MILNHGDIDYPTWLMVATTQVGNNDYIKTTIFAFFGGNNSNVIEYTIGLTYAELLDLIDTTYGSTVNSLKFVVKDLAGNKTEINLTITR